MRRAAVFGAGSWGTAFGQVLSDAGVTTTIWARRAELAARIDSAHENPDYLPGVRLPAGLRATPVPGAAVEGADLVVFAVPAQLLRACLTSWVPLLPPDALLVSLIKGVELDTHERMTEVILELTAAPRDRVLALSGPNLSREIAGRQPAAAVIACTDPAAAGRLQQACTTSYLRLYTNTDVVGTELGGAVKNVIALGVGMAEGMGFGDNARATLITRGLAETSRLGVALGADPLTFAGLAGLGDLVATCSSPLSRNRTVGEQLGRGVSLAEVEGSTRMVAEGVASSRSILSLARVCGVDMPITAHVVAVLDRELSPHQLMERLMSRELKPERPL